MKLEAVDRRNPMLLRVATVVDVRPSQLLVHFDGWSDSYDYWVDDDCPDIHPPGWCHRTGHELMPPPSQFFVDCCMLEVLYTCSRVSTTIVISAITCEPAMLQAGIAFGGVHASVRVSVCLHKISKTTGPKLM